MQLVAKNTNHKIMKILFMGTPEFAVATLDSLYKAGYDIVGVVTVPDKPVGRGLKLGASPVKIYAETHNLRLFQPEKLRNPEFISEIEALEPDVAVVVAFRMLPEIVWRLPKLGTLNLHASLLPDYRGAAPINWAVANGEKFSGITTFFIDKEIDTGNLLLQEKVEIPEEWNAGNLHDALMEKGAELVLKTVQQIQTGNLVPQPQNAALARHIAPKIQKEDCRINWAKSAEEIHNFVRGMSPFPGAFTTINGKIIKIFQTEIQRETETILPAGKIQISLKKDKIWVATHSGGLIIKDLQLEGKKRMKAGDLLRGLNETWENFI